MTSVPGTSTYVAWQEAFWDFERACPWPGPRPLSKDDGVRLLVGRERDRRLFNHEVQNHRLILLGGESGVGKSSLLNAGLVPDLEAAGYTVVACRDWGAAIAGDDDLFLAQAVYTALKPEHQKKVADPAAATGRPLELFYTLEHQFGDWLVIIFDQFEELLRYNRARKDQIVRRIVEIHRACAVRIVLSFRSEYLHELKDIETGASPFGISRYILDPVEPRFAADVIKNTRDQVPPPMTKEVAADIARQWGNATLTKKNDQSASRLVTPIGMLHLQAMLYALHARADGQVIAQETYDKLREEAKTIGKADADLFAYGLQQAVRIKLERCERAAAQQNMDRFLYRGAATVLTQAVDHLSSGGYKLVREAYDLAALVLDEKIEAGLSAMGGDRALGSQEEVEAFLNRMLFAIASDSLRDEPGPLRPADPDAGTAQSPVSGTGDGMTARRAELARRADDADQTERRGELSWVRLLQNRQGAAAPNNPASGPMRGLSPADVLIEEFRRFAWALVWLKESNLIRITRLGSQSMVSLIHDGLGEALLEWAKDYGTRDRAWAMYSLTAPMGASHMWHEDDQMWVEPDGTEGKMQGELSGDEGRPIVLGNLVFKGNSILGAQFKHTVFLNCDFRGTLFLDCSFAGVTFVNCQLDGALFSDCTIIGQPDPATCVPIDHDIEKSIPDNPQFNVPYAPELARTFRRYREEGPGATVYLVSREAGRPAYASDTALTEGAGWLSWTPARAGLAMYGGRVSALTFRGTVFQDGRIAFRGVIGTGLDLAELDGADFEFHRCVLRHVAFSTGNDRTSGTIKVVVDFTVAVQWWFGNSLEGSMTTRKSRLLHLWNDSRNVRVSIDDPEKTTQTMGPESRDYPTSGDLSGVVALTEYRRGRHLAE